jgi:putative tricarboxylic transport membrane protein
MDKHEMAFTSLWMGIGLFVSAYSYTLGVGGIGSPGPGFFPFFLGSIFFLMSFLHGCKLVFRKNREGRKTEEGAARKDTLKLGLLVFSLLMYALLLDALGYQITTFLVLVLLFKIAGNKSWFRVILYSGISLAATYFFFTYLGVRFPTGIMKWVKLS